MHLSQEGKLLLQAILFILQLNALKCLRVQLGRDPLDLAQQALGLDLVALGLVLQIAQTSLQQVDLGLVLGDLLVQVVDARLVGIAVVQDVAVAFAEALGIFLAGARLELGIGLVLAGLIDQVLGLK